MDLEFNKSTASLLDSFPMFGHPGISALEYAGRVEAKKRESLLSSAELSSLKRKSTNASLPDENTAPLAMGSPKVNSTEASPQLHSIDEFGTQQRRRGNFMNHTPRDHELRSSRPIEVYRPSRAESDHCENYSRPLSRHGSMASGSPALPTQFCRCGTANSGSLERQLEFNHGLTTALEFVTRNFNETPDVYPPSTASTRRSVSAPLDGTIIHSPQPPRATNQNNGSASVRSPSLSSHHSQEKKRQRRQTPFKLSVAEARVPRHEPLEPWLAQHRRKKTSETIGDVPFDMNREVSAEMGPFGVIQRYFDSQGGGPVTAPSPLEYGLPSSPADSPPPVPKIPSSQQLFDGPIAIYPIDEMTALNEPPPVPNRSPRRLTNPNFPLPVTSVLSGDTEYKSAAQGEYSPYKHLEDQDEDDDVYEPGRRIAAHAGSSKMGKMAPPILGHHALIANTDLGNNQLSQFLRLTGPPGLSVAAERKKNGMRLFKAKQRTLAARVGSVEGSPQRVRKTPDIPDCTRETTTFAGSKHLRIVIPSETPRGSVAISMPSTIRLKQKRRSRHISILFTEEMLNPLASPEVERIISMYDHNPLTDPYSRPASAPLPRSSPKRSPKFEPRCEPVSDHPLAASRKEETRARKLRDLQRIKRKPLPFRTLSASHIQPSSMMQPQPQQQQQKHIGSLPTSGAPLTPAQTPEPPVESSPSSPMSSPIIIRHQAEQNDSGIEDQSPTEKMSDLQKKVMVLQRQNEKLTAVLAKIVGVDLGGEGGLDDLDGLGGEEVLRAWRKLRLEG